VFRAAGAEKVDTFRRKDAVRKGQPFTFLMMCRRGKTTRQKKKEKSSFPKFPYLPTLCFSSPLCGLAGWGGEVGKLIRAAREGPHVLFSFSSFRVVLFFLCYLLFFLCYLLFFLCSLLFFFLFVFLFSSSSFVFFFFCLLLFLLHSQPIPKKLPGWKRSVFTARSVSTYETSQKEFFFSFQRLKMET